MNKLPYMKIHDEDNDNLGRIVNKALYMRIVNKTCTVLKKNCVV